VLPKNNRELRQLVDEVFTKAQAIYMNRGDLVAAHRKRYRPDLGDLIDFAAGEMRMYPAGSPHELPYEKGNTPAM
jgi:hypothetical protein